MSIFLSWSLDSPTFSGWENAYYVVRVRKLWMKWTTICKNGTGFPSNEYYVESATKWLPFGRMSDWKKRTGHSALHSQHLTCLPTESENVNIFLEVKSNYVLTRCIMSRLTATSSKKAFRIIKKNQELPPKNKNLNGLTNFHPRIWILN